LGSIGSVLLAVFAVKSIGGIGALKAGLAARYGTSEAMRRLQFVPRPGERFFETFMVFVTLKWWGNPPSSLTQRILAAKDERHATFSMMLFAVVHFALNYWPMIIVGLVSFVMHPYLPADKAEQGYAIIMMDVLPTGVLGLALASMVAAFMSTIDTYVNGGASFMVNDLYRRFIKKGASEAHYVRASQVSSVLMLALGLLTFYGISSVKTAWEYLATMTAGYGIIAVARWFWWRINAEAEFASLAGSAIGSLIFNHMIHVDSFGLRFLAVALVSSATWIITALATPPSEMESLAKFCRVVRPYPLGWKPVRERYPDIEWSPRLGRNVILWFVGLVTVFSVCFGVGQLLLGSANIGGWMLLLAIFGGAIVARYYRA
jgi:SSS family solute:Na+ symporter